MTASATQTTRRSRLPHRDDRGDSMTLIRMTRTSVLALCVLAMLFAVAPAATAQTTPDADRSPGRLRGAGGHRRSEDLSRMQRPGQPHRRVGRRIRKLRALLDRRSPCGESAADDGVPADRGHDPRVRLRPARHVRRGGRPGLHQPERPHPPTHHPAGGRRRPPRGAADGRRPRSVRPRRALARRLLLPDVRQHLSRRGGRHGAARRVLRVPRAHHRAEAVAEAREVQRPEQQARADSGLRRQRDDSVRGAATPTCAS